MSEIDHTLPDEVAARVASNNESVDPPRTSMYTGRSAIDVNGWHWYEFIDEVERFLVSVQDGELWISGGDGEGVSDRIEDLDVGDLSGGRID